MSSASFQAAGGSTSGASVFSAPTWPADEGDSTWRHVASQQSSPITTPMASPTTVEELDQMPEAVARAKLTKTQRRNRLRTLWTTKDVDTAKSLTKEIVAEWSGNGLHVFEALRLLGNFQGEAVQAIEMVFELLDKLGQCWASTGERRVIWQNIKQGNGQASRYLKRADFTLTHLICLHWQPPLKDVGVDQTKWYPLLERLGTAMNVIERHMFIPWDMAGQFKGGKRILLPNSSKLCILIHHYQYARLVAYKVAEKNLPIELVEMIADQMAPRSAWSRFMKAQLGRLTQIRVRGAIKEPETAADGSRR